MRTRHVTQQIEAYLDGQFSLEERRQIEEHLSICATCHRYLYKSKRLRNELGPLLRDVLGTPTPSAGLPHKIREQLKANQPGSARFFGWETPGRILNAVGTLAVIALLAFGILFIIQGQLPGSNTLLGANSLRSNPDGGSNPTVTATNTSVSMVLATVTPQSVSKSSSLGDTLPQRNQEVGAETTSGEKITAIPTLSFVNRQAAVPSGEVKEPAANPESELSNLPGGTIAFSLYNPAAHRQVYEIHHINPDGTDHQLFPLDGVSEPAMKLVGGNYQIAYRAWGEPTTPRSLASNNLLGDQPDPLTHFWEDAQPDWSPTENRLIFASQRESDRRWRLYTVWGDGSLEVNLRREGKSPTFAPDGYRFAFESCDDTGNRCGLWVSDLDHSEHEAYPFLIDPLAKSPDWSPTGEQIAYMANLDGNWDLYLVDSEGNNRQRLTTDQAIDGLPTWSPDGNWLTFLSNRGGKWGIWLIHVESGDLSQIFDFEEGLSGPTDYSLYGERHWWDEQLSWSR